MTGIKRIPWSRDTFDEFLLEAHRFHYTIANAKPEGYDPIGLKAEAGQENGPDSDEYAVGTTPPYQVLVTVNGAGQAGVSKYKHLDAEPTFVDGIYQPIETGLEAEPDYASNDLGGARGNQ